VDNLEVKSFRGEDMSNKEIRMQALNDVKRNWWLSVAVLFVGYMIVSASANFNFIGLLFLGYPIYFGIAKYMMALRAGYGEFDDLFGGFKENYMDNILTILIRELLVLLWSLLLIVPGVIKAISYAMTPYILVDYDFKETHMDALNLSERMMDGYKMKFFKMELYFLLWHLLGALTFGILTFLYVVPYQEMAHVEFYYEVKKNIKIEKPYQQDSPLPKQVEEIKSSEWDF
jgi:uncharacterized membrane protein